MQLMDTVTNETPNFLDTKPKEQDKTTWQRAYATYLCVTKKTPEECANKPLSLRALLPVLGEHDQRWKAVDADMMKTTHTMVHRMNVELRRFKEKVWQVKVLMQEIRTAHESSADVDQTVGVDLTDSEKSNEEPEQGDHT